MAAKFSVSEILLNCVASVKNTPRLKITHSVAGTCMATYRSRFCNLPELYHDRWWRLAAQSLMKKLCMHGGWVCSR